MEIQFISPATLWGETSWENYNTGKCGGTESTVLHVARELEALGHNVRVLTELDGKPEVGIGVNCVLPKDSASRIYIDSHQGWSGIPSYIDGVFLRSYYHQTLQRQVNPDLDIDRCFIPGNGIDPAEWEGPFEKQKNMFIWASTPERGLIHLLKLWPRIIMAKPDAELHIYYDVYRALDGWRWGVNKMSLDCEETYLILKTPPNGVFVHGMVSRAEYLTTMKRAEYLLYTCDPQAPSELFCMTIAEALAARVKIVIPAEVDALESLWKPYCITIAAPPVPEYPNNAINNDWVSAATDDIPFPDADVNREYVLNTYSWYNVAKRYEDVLLGKEMDFGKPKLVLIPGIIGDN